jgi:glycosyltransferase involved in cell wall biosynthesis
MRIVLLTTDNREHYKEYTAARPYFGTAPEALLQGFELLPAAEVHVVSCTRQPVAAPQKIGSNLFFHSLLVPRIGWMRTAYQGCIRAVRRQIKTLKPDIVHGQGTELDCAISAVFSGRPNVITIHGNMRLIAAVTGARILSFPWLAARLEQFTVPRTDGVVCLSRYTQQAMLPLARRTWVVSNAVDSSFFEIAPDPSAAQPPRILCVGHVDARKNQNAFIRALDPLAKRCSLKVVFLGKVNKARPYDAEFLSLVAARPWCAHEGFASREQLKAHLRQTTLLALPSIEDNCPMVVLEAMAAGVPVMAANVGGLPDLIETGQTGVLCDPLDPLSIQNSIEKVLLDPAAAAGMARRAKQRAREKFHPKVIASRHLDLYHEVLNHRTPG